MWISGYGYVGGLMDERMNGLVGEWVVTYVGEEGWAGA